MAGCATGVSLHQRLSRPTLLFMEIDHSSGTHVHVRITKTAVKTKIIVYDNGEGIFKKIRRELGLHDERHSVLELAKGKSS